jgi:hypothetical protein
MRVNLNGQGSLGAATVGISAFLAIYEHDGSLEFESRKRRCDMAIIFYKPVITAQNYAAFQRILKDAPKTFDEWSHVRTQHLAHIEGSGGRVIDIDIDPDEFTAYCHETGAPYTLKSLDDFAFEKGSRKQE